MFQPFSALSFRTCAVRILPKLAFFPPRASISLIFSLSLLFCHLLWPSNTRINVTPDLSAEQFFVRGLFVRLGLRLLKEERVELCSVKVSSSLSTYRFNRVGRPYRIRGVYEGVTNRIGFWSWIRAPLVLPLRQRRHWQNMWRNLGGELEETRSCQVRRDVLRRVGQSEQENRDLASLHLRLIHHELEEAGKDVHAPGWQLFLLRLREDRPYQILASC
jgi:hypothetical protein